MDELIGAQHWPSSLQSPASYDNTVNNSGIESPSLLDLWSFRQPVPARKDSCIEGKDNQGRFYSYLR